MLYERPGEYEPTNELFYAAFAAELDERFPDLAADAAPHGVLHGRVIPQIKRQVRQWPMRDFRAPQRGTTSPRVAGGAVPARVARDDGVAVRVLRAVPDARIRLHAR